MEYIYAAMLLHKAGKEINEANLTQVMTSAGINVDAVRVKALVASLAEVKIDEAIKSAPTMMAAPAAPAAAAPAAEAKPKEEERRRKTEGRSST
jgi:large subunit ribosomal protein L12